MSQNKRSSKRKAGAEAVAAAHEPSVESDWKDLTTVELKRTAKAVGVKIPGNMGQLKLIKLLVDHKISKEGRAPPAQAAAAAPKPQEDKKAADRPTESEAKPPKKQAKKKKSARKLKRTASKKDNDDDDDDDGSSSSSDDEKETGKNGSSSSDLDLNPPKASKKSRTGPGSGTGTGGGTGSGKSGTNTFDPKDWAPFFADSEMKTLAALNPDQRQEVALARMTGKTKRPDADTSSSAAANSGNGNGGGGGNNNSSSEFTGQYAGLGKYAGVIDSKTLKASVDGQYVDVSHFSLPIRASLRSPSPAEVSTALTGSHHTPFTNPALPSSVVNQYRVSDEFDNDSVRIPVGTSSGGVQFALTGLQPKRRHRALLNFRDWREAWYIYTNIVCEHLTRAHLRVMFNSYAYELELLNDQIGFIATYSFDCEWRMSRTNFQSLAFEHAGHRIALSLTRTLFERQASTATPAPIAYAAANTSSPAAQHNSAASFASRNSDTTDTKRDTPVGGTRQRKAVAVAAKWNQPNTCANYNIHKCRNTPANCKYKHQCFNCSKPHPLAECTTHKGDGNAGNE